jgi:NAD/NADP transhydrogenase beta subunit
MRQRVITIPSYGSARHETSGEDRLAHVRTLAQLMDSRFTIPGTNIRFGLDPLIGLFLPGIGSIASSVVSLALISTMAKYGASRHLVIRMLLNVLLDTTIGAIPLLGSVFDVFYRANDRNFELLRRHYDEGRYQGSGAGLIAIVLTVLAIVCALIVWGFIAFLRWLF